MVKTARTAHSPIPETRFNADAWYYPDPKRKGAVSITKRTLTYFGIDNVSDRREERIFPG
jgi:hypothetical protein